ncbi:NACHT N-terminal helical domain 7-containing protein [Streptomyces sp. CS62]|uniref:NACHT N-terminal helical domain 7-containing protein n=1 Tax=Streptomyces sp. CS62 TaxID=3119268 RepID=UPI003FA706C2
MGGRRLLSLSDALVLLGGDPPAVAALDRALGGALGAATGGIGDGLLRIADARGSIVALGRDAVHGLGRRLGHAQGRAERTRLLHAAHTVIVVVAWFEALDASELPFRVDDLELTRGEQLALAGAPERNARGAAFAHTLAAVDAPRPAPHRPSEDVAAELLRWYGALSDRFLSFAEGLHLWSALTPSARSAAVRALGADLAPRAVARYEDLYARLAQEAPEFGFWTAQVEHQATRDRIRLALAGIEELLSGAARGMRPPADVAASLARAAEAVLARPVLDASTAPDGIRVPALRDMYLDPDFRVRAADGTGGPATEAWWEEVPVRRDLTGLPRRSPHRSGRGARAAARPRPARRRQVRPHPRPRRPPPLRRLPARPGPAARRTRRGRPAGTAGAGGTRRHRRAGRLARPGALRGRRGTRPAPRRVRRTPADDRRPPQRLPRPGRPLPAARGRPGPPAARRRHQPHRRRRPHPLPGRARGPPPGAVPRRPDTPLAGPLERG